MAAHERRRSLLELLKNATSPTNVTELSVALAVSPRTIHKDLSKLKESGIKVRTVMGRGGGVALANTDYAMGNGISGPGVLRTRSAHHAKFVGRDYESARLGVATEQVLDGAGRLVVLSGEPGIGKSRLCQEADSHARAAGFRTVWGFCLEDGGAPPFWLWTQVLRQLVAGSVSSDEVRDGQALLSRIAPDFQTALVRPNKPSNLEEPETTRFKLFDAVSTFLLKSSNEQPLAIILEDLHWADESTLDLLKFVAHGIPASRILIIGTFRDTEVNTNHPRSNLFSSIQRLDEHIDVHPLRRDEVDLMIDGSVSTSNFDQVAKKVFERSEGNPLFVSEIVRFMRQDGKDELPDRALPLGVKQIIHGRTSRLSKPCLRLLTAAAVLETEFEIGILQKIYAEVDTVDIFELVDEALAHRLIEETDRYGVLRFSHGLVRETLNDDQSRTESTQLHALAADVLETHYGERAAEHAAELAHHLGEARPIADNGRYIKYLLQAGNSSLDSYAFHDARSYFEKAIGAIEQEPESEHQSEALFGLAKTLMSSGDLAIAQEGVELLDRVFTVAIENGDKSLAIEIASTRLPTAAQFTGIVSILERALPLVDTGSVTEGYLLSEYAQHLYYETADAEEANRASDRAIEIAEVNDEDDLRAIALTKSVSVAAHQANLPRCVELARQAVEVGTLAGNEFFVAHSSFHLATKGAALGHPDESRLAVQMGQQAAVRSGLPWRVGDARFSEMYLACLSGEFDAVREFWTAAASGASLNSRELQFFALVSYWLGDKETGRNSVEQMITLAKDTPSDIFASLEGVIAGSLLLRFAHDSRHVPFAKIIGKRLIDAQNTSELIREATSAALGWIAIIERDVESASEFTTYFESGRSLPIGSIETTNSGHVLAMLHKVTGEFDRALDRFEHTASFLRDASYRPELALVLADYAELLAERGGQDNKHAVKLLDEATAIAVDLGMTPLEEQIRDLKDAINEKRSNASDPPYGLTDREIEILRLVSNGLSNPEIAKHLVISRHTVVRHLANLYAKTGVANRSEAAALSVRISNE